jgi:hypothetical protein
MTQETAEKELEKFKKEYQKLMSKYPKIMVATDVRGCLTAFHLMTYNSKVILDK